MENAWAIGLAAGGVIVAAIGIVVTVSLWLATRFADRIENRLNRHSQQHARLEGRVDQISLRNLPEGASGGDAAG